MNIKKYSLSTIRLLYDTIHILSPFFHFVADTTQRRNDVWKMMNCVLLSVV